MSSAADPGAGGGGSREARDEENLEVEGGGSRETGGEGSSEAEPGSPEARHERRVGAGPDAGADAERRREARTPGQRLFVGARISVATAHALAGAAQTLARRARDAGVDIRWISPMSYHVTLRFLGWTRTEAIGAVRDALEDGAAGIAPLSFRTVRLGAFPSLDRASVVWAGVEAPAPLAELARRIEAACARLGYAPEKRAFHPHVTIGRLRETRAVRAVVLPLAEQMFGDSALDTITVFESETKSSGSVYRELHKIRLESRSGAPISAPERQSPPVQLAASPALDPDTDDGWPRGQGATTEHDA